MVNRKRKHENKTQYELQWAVGGERFGFIFYYYDIVYSKSHFILSWVNASMMNGTKLINEAEEAGRCSPERAKKNYAHNLDKRP